MSELKGAKVVVVSESKTAQNLFYEHFYRLETASLVSLSSSWNLSVLEGKDVLVIPCDNAWGIPTKLTRQLVDLVGPRLEMEVKNQIFQMFFGEQPRGTSFLIPWREVKGSPKSPRYICWSCFGRTKKDIPEDFCYSTLWSAFAQIHVFNKQLKASKEIGKEGKDKKKKKEKKEKELEIREAPLKTIVIPEFTQFLEDIDPKEKDHKEKDKDKIKDKDKEKEPESKVSVLSRQMAMVLKSWLLGEMVEVDDIQAGEKRHTEITQPEAFLNRKALEMELAGMLWSREILTRGLCSSAELDILVNWVSDDGNYTLTAANAICDLLRRPPTDFALTPEDVSLQVTSNKRCISKLLNLGTERKINIHTEISRKELTFGDKIGTGNVGVVSKGTWKDKSVAIKTFGSTILDTKEFIKEVVMLSLVKAPGIVACYGACTDEGDKFIVEELMQASLYDLLHDSNFELPYSLQVDFAHQIACCMLHLHNCGLIHRDLKSLNILYSVINGKKTLKICDFGLTRLVDKNKAMTSNIGTVSWIAPEVFSRKNYSEKADIYSYGIIAWELASREMPFGEVESFSVPLLVVRGERPTIPKECTKEFSRIISSCWNQKPNKRPDFGRIESILRKMKESSQINSNAPNIYADQSVLLKEGSQRPLGGSGDDNSVSESHSLMTTSLTEQEESEFSNSHTVSPEKKASLSRKSSKGKPGPFVRGTIQ